MNSWRDNSKSKFAIIMSVAFMLVIGNCGISLASSGWGHYGMVLT